MNDGSTAQLLMSHFNSGQANILSITGIHLLRMKILNSRHHHKFDIVGMSSRAIPQARYNALGDITHRLIAPQDIKPPAHWASEKPQEPVNPR